MWCSWDISFHEKKFIDRFAQFSRKEEGQQCGRAVLARLDRANGLPSNARQNRQLFLRKSALGARDSQAVA
jgi:hypothetical protein